MTAQTLLPHVLRMTWFCFQRRGAICLGFLVVLNSITQRLNLLLFWGSQRGENNSLGTVISVDCKGQFFKDSFQKLQVRLHVISNVYFTTAGIP
jgi:hypothetical protein